MGSACIGLACLIIGLSSYGHAHGPTLCVGNVTYTSSSLDLDLRFGVGLLHKYVDPNDDAKISPDEWTSSSDALKSLMTSQIRVKTTATSFTATKMKLEMTDGYEIRVQAEYPLPPAADKPELALPILAKLPGLPPAIISVWEGDKMVKPPAMINFAKNLSLTQ